MPPARRACTAAAHQLESELQSVQEQIDAMRRSAAKGAPALAALPAHDGSVCELLRGGSLSRAHLFEDKDQAWLLTEPPRRTNDQKARPPVARRGRRPQQLPRSRRAPLFETPRCRHTHTGPRVRFC